MTTRRDILRLAASGTAALACSSYAVRAVALPAGASAEAGSQTLAKRAFDPLPLGAVRPAGWLQRQLRIQADGLSGHLDETWPDVGPNSGWLGGTGESWERGPYWLDGLIPLAYLLNDDVLKAKAQRFIDWVLTHQQPNGMLGPASNNDWWPRMVLVKALAQYEEATGDKRVVPALTRYFHYQLETMPGRPLFEWGKYRWQDEALVAQWLYERTADPKLLDLARLLETQGFDWVGSFADFRYTGPTKPAVLDNKGAENFHGMQTHGVNNGQALKTAAVQYRLTGDGGERAGFYRQLDTLYRFHGEPNGMFSCDEHLAGLNPSQGTELCTVVETMFSLEVALAVFGDAPLADRLEKIAYNALPGTLTEDMWAHQYDQQSNQVQVSLNSKPWTTNGIESNLYGLEPNFGCCTANFHQGWPKLTEHLWMRSGDGGLVAAVYAPCTVNTAVRGVPVRIAEETEYPFRGTVRVRIDPERPAEFPLQLRVPGWAEGATLEINGAAQTLDAGPGSFATVTRRWQAGDRVELSFPMPPRVARWFNRSLAVERGPLVFSLSPGESWVKLQDRGLTADWQVFPERPWNYGLLASEGEVASLRVEERAVAAHPFSTSAPAVVVHAGARRLPAWRAEDGVAPAPPPSPVKSSAEVEEIALVPYAGAKLRVTAFPQVVG